jgi:hypothetical protein
LSDPVALFELAAEVSSRKPQRGGQPARTGRGRSI